MDFRYSNYRLWESSKNDNKKNELTKAKKLSRVKPISKNHSEFFHIDHDSKSDDENDSESDSDEADQDQLDANKQSAANIYHRYLRTKRQKFDDFCEEQRLYLQKLREHILEIQRRRGEKFHIDPPQNRFANIPLGDPEWRICDTELLSPVKYYTSEVWEYFNKFYFEPEDPKLAKLFQGVCIFVNGYTNPVASHLHTLMLFTGGRYTLMFDRYQTTHTISNVLSVAQRKSERARKTTVKPEWIIESLRARKILPLCKYLLWKPKNKIQEMFARMNKRMEHEGQKQAKQEANNIQTNTTEGCFGEPNKPSTSNKNLSNDVILDELDYHQSNWIVPKCSSIDVKSFQPSQPTSILQLETIQEQQFKEPPKTICGKKQANQERNCNQHQKEQEGNKSQQLSPVLIFDDDFCLKNFKNANTNDDFEQKFLNVLNNLEGNHKRTTSMKIISKHSKKRSTDKDKYTCLKESTDKKYIKEVVTNYKPPIQATIEDCNVVEARASKNNTNLKPKDFSQFESKNLNTSNYMQRSMNDFDLQVLNQLSEDIHQEVIGYVNEKKSTAEKEPPIQMMKTPMMVENQPKNINNKPTTSLLLPAPLPTMRELYKNRTVDTLFKRNKSDTSPSKGGTKRGSFRKMIQSKMEGRKQLRIDFMLKREMIRQTDPKHRARDIYFGRRGRRQPNICGKVCLKDVCHLLEEWIVTTEKLVDLDVTYVLKYLLGLVDMKHFQDLKQVLCEMKKFILEKCDQSQLIVAEWKMMFSETFYSVLHQEPSIPDALLPDSLFQFN